MRYKDFFLNAKSLVFPFLLTWAFALLLCMKAEAQSDRQIDSLNNLLAVVVDDSARVDLLNALALVYVYGQPEMTVAKAEAALALAEETGYKKGKAWALNRLGGGYWLLGKFPTALQYFLDSKKLATEINDGDLVARNIGNAGLIYRGVGNLQLALQYFREAYDMNLALGADDKAAVNLSNIGDTYMRLKDYDAAEKFLFKALPVIEKTHSTWEPNILFDIADLRYRQERYQESLPYLEKALVLAAKFNNRRTETEVYQVWAEIELHFGQTSTAEEKARRSLAIAQKNNFKEELYKAYQTLAKVLYAERQYEAAYIAKERFVFYKDSLQSETAKNQLDLFDFEKKQSDLVLLKKEQALEKANSQKQRVLIYSLGGFLALALVSAVGFFNSRQSERRAKNLIIQQKTEIQQVKEEIESQSENLKQASIEIQQSYQDIKALSDIGQHITSILDFGALLKTIHHEVQLMMPAEAFGIGILNSRLNRLEFAGFVEKTRVLPFHSDYLSSEKSLAVWCFKNKQPVFIQDFAKECQQYLGIKVDVAEVGELPQSLIYLPLVFEGKPIGVITVQSFQMGMYEEKDLALLGTLASYIAIGIDNARAYETIRFKNKHITDSISYAHTIQTAILPGKGKIDRSIENHFVIFRPKDIVSGDFYWFSHIHNQGKEYMFLAAVDCTGHGVPGAFMSMIGNTLLNEIVNQNDVYGPADILENLDFGVRMDLRQGEKANNDGMDVCLCRIEKTALGIYEVQFAGAKRSLFYIKNDKMEEIKGVRRSIGGREIARPFETVTIQLEEGCTLYLSTDGFADQNDANDQKFGTKRLLDLLLKTHKVGCAAQKRLLEDALDGFMAGTEQRDDITLLAAGF